MSLGCIIGYVRGFFHECMRRKNLGNLAYALVVHLSNIAECGCCLEFGQNDLVRISIYMYFASVFSIVYFALSLLPL